MFEQMPTFDQRILVNVAATLSFQGVDADGTAADPGTVTVTLTRGNGTALITDAATTGSSTSPRTYSLSAANNGYLDWLTATWKVSGTTVGTTKIEVVGGYWASVATIRSEEPALSNASTYPAAKILAARWEAEKEADQRAHVAFVPRYRRARLDGNGRSRLVLPDAMLRSVRSVRVYSDATTYSSFTAAELAAIPASSAGFAERTDGGSWTEGTANIVIEYEHGYDRPPADLLRLFYSRVRHFAVEQRRGMSDAATGYTLPDGTVVQVAGEFAAWFAKLAEYGARDPSVA